MGKKFSDFDKGEFVEHQACPSCPSSDALAVYSSGYVTCYACDYYKYPDQEGASSHSNEKSMTKKAKKPYPMNDVLFLPKRGISKATMEFMGYGIGEYKGEPAHLVAIPHADGTGHAATKVRLPHKEFRIAGDTSDCGFIFQNKWNGGGRKLVITEGEFDALSVAEAQSCKWPVVSLPNGATAAEKVFKQAYKFVNSFDEIVLWFDDDAPGREAAEAAALVCDIGKVRIAKTPLGMKDANEVLKSGNHKAIIDAIWQAEKYTPARFVDFASLKEEVLKPVERGVPWIFDELNEWTYGRRDGETYFFGAGTGVGKTDFFTQQAAADIAAGRKVALFSFEQNPKETAKRLAGKYSGHRFHVPDAGWTPADLNESFDALADKGAFIYKHWGSADWDTVETDITALAHMGYTEFYIDHLTAFAAHADDERKMLEATCADMAQTANKLGVRFYVISHLSTPDGVPHEEGGRVFIRHFKGSRAIGYWAHFMFGIERDTQAEDLEYRARAKFRCLKDRFTGQATGNVLTMKYDPETGLQSVDPDWKWEEPSSGKQSAADHGFTNQDF